MKALDRRSAFLTAAVILTGSTSSWMIFNAGVSAALAAVEGLRPRLSSQAPLSSRARRGTATKHDD
jgi:hypothetical protein